MGKIIDFNLSNSLNDLKNNEQIKKKLIQSSFYLFTYKMMKKSIIENIKRLYEVSDELIEKRIDKEDVLKIYDYEVLSLDKDYFLAHIKWLKNMKIINNTDYKNLYYLRKERNDIVHNIDKFVFYHDKRLKKIYYQMQLKFFLK